RRELGLLLREPLLETSPRLVRGDAFEEARLVVRADLRVEPRELRFRGFDLFARAGEPLSALDDLLLETRKARTQLRVRVGTLPERDETRGERLSRDRRAEIVSGVAEELTDGLLPSRSEHDELLDFAARAISKRHGLAGRLDRVEPTRKLRGFERGLEPGARDALPPKVLKGVHCLLRAAHLGSDGVLALARFLELARAL